VPASAVPASVPASAVAVALGAAGSLEGDVPAARRSKAPSAAEWLTARPVKLTRQSPKAASCATTRVREWIRVRCASKTFAISLLGGSTDGLSFWIGTEAEGRFAEVQLPLRRGDRRVVQIWATRDEPSGGSVVEPSLVLQELWVEGDAAPTVTVL